ncbi:MAG: Uma2 family endonuclease [Symploca sp. SIO3E6]|nr:Uma2 family endonuclease [Caldora sp. SIO3E6]
MYAVISKEKTQLAPGTVVRMPGTWQDYHSLRESRSDRSIPRIKYRQGEILLMSPMPRHGREANILADIVKALLDSQNRNYEAFTPITMELPEEQGIEPDYCFYITHWQAVVGKERINWQVDPPPDLVIEIDVTSYTAVEDYLAYRVPEVWLFRNKSLKIYQLQQDNYQLCSFSLYFPTIDLLEIVDRVFQQAAEQGTGVALRELRQNLEFRI